MEYVMIGKCAEKKRENTLGGAIKHYIEYIAFVICDRFIC
jgi:hypothetical protein